MSMTHSSFKNSKDKTGPVVSKKPSPYDTKALLGIIDEITNDKISKCTETSVATLNIPGEMEAATRKVIIKKSFD